MYTISAMFMTGCTNVSENVHSNAELCIETEQEFG